MALWTSEASSSVLLFAVSSYQVMLHILCIQSSCHSRQNGKCAIVQSKIFLWLNHFTVTDVNIFCWLYSSEKINSHVIQDNLSFTIHFSLAILPKNLHGFSNSSTIDNPLYYLTVSIMCSKIRSGWENYPQLPISFMSSYRKVDC